ncbi:MAG: response regulator [Lachnospiraceae bacterium]|nr:response regulator [Lachnospiraceae bacterium]
MLEEKIKQFYDKLFSVILEDIVAIIEINHIEKSYHVSEGNQYVKNLFPETGTLRTLYRFLFQKGGASEGKKSGDYDRFVDETVFQKDKYQGDIRFQVNGEEIGLHFLLLNVSSEESMLLFFSEAERELSNMREMEKIDTLQESYLFSMIVDLAEDSCVNPNTTEINATRQDYMVIKYSDWRVMISNMFKEEDKVLFLRASSPENVMNTLEMKNSFHIDLQMKNMQGEFVWCRLNFVRMKSFSRENPRFVYTVSDISEDMLQLLRQEGLVKAIEEQNERLQEADKNKTKFFSNMSHEIRTPINSIMGMNEVILRDCKDEEIRGYARDVKAASQYLLSLVNDILDYSKIEAGKMEIVPVEYDMTELIHRVYNIIRPKLVEKNLEFELKVGEDVPSRLFGDEIRIAQILINLLTNAVKYTDQGKVSFWIERQEDVEGQASIKFTVKDTGIGIKKEDMDTLFAEFGRLDLLRNRNMEGTGLGMSIVEGLLMQMNSRMIVESVYGKGSVFSFTLLQKVVDECAVDLSDTHGEDVKLETAIAGAQDKLVLVVDDTAVNLHLFEALMAPYKMEVHCAKSGEKALKMMHANKYNIVFLDHMMPGMDGVETLAQLRQIDTYYKSVPVIALTGHYSPTAREEYISLGFTDYLEKPIILKKLDEVIHRYIYEMR